MGALNCSACGVLIGDDDGIYVPVFIPRVAGLEPVLLDRTELPGGAVRELHEHPSCCGTVTCLSKILSDPKWKRADWAAKRAAREEDAKKQSEERVDWDAKATERDEKLRVAFGPARAAWGCVSDQVPTYQHVLSSLAKDRLEAMHLFSAQPLELPPLPLPELSLLMLDAIASMVGHPATDAVRDAERAYSKEYDALIVAAMVRTP